MPAALEIRSFVLSVVGTQCKGNRQLRTLHGLQLVFDHIKPSLRVSLSLLLLCGCDSPGSSTLDAQQDSFSAIIDSSSQMSAIGDDAGSGLAPLPALSVDAAALDAQAAVDPNDEVFASRPIRSETDGGMPTCRLSSSGSWAGLTHTMAPCSDEIIQRVKTWQPDVVVVLGGGLLQNDGGSCATLQRAFAAKFLLGSLPATTRVVLTGHGQYRGEERLDPETSACLIARYKRVEFSSTSERERMAASTMISTIQRTNRAYATEADVMCSELLRHVRSDRWAAALDRVLFEPRASSTPENAVRTWPILQALQAQRVLVLTTPVVHRDSGLDNHPKRALAEFRSVRRNHQGNYQLGAVGCPYVNGGPTYVMIEDISDAGAESVDASVDGTARQNF